MSIDSTIREALLLLVIDEDICASDIEASNLVHDFLEVTNTISFNKVCELYGSQHGIPFDFLYDLYRLYNYCQNLGRLEGLKSLSQASEEFIKTEHERAWRKNIAKDSFRRVLDLCCFLDYFREEDGEYYCLKYSF